MIQRQKKREVLEKRYRPKRLQLKERIRKTLDFYDKFALYQKLQKFPRNSSITRLHNRCFITGRPRAFYGDFGLSRHVLREMAHQCLLPGLTKASW